jgi:hypothetical protein
MLELNREPANVAQVGLDNNKEGCISAIRGSLWLVQGEESSRKLHSFYILPAHACRELLT